nr:hypothetical protein CFP56_05260 [Quercus suber]POF06773.1 hypothetical protein CFP56_73606 [Quercus suber]
MAMIIPLIVRPYQIFPFDIERIEIFSLKTFNWKTILGDVDNISNYSVPLIPNTTYFNGAIYLRARKYVKPSIIYFDLAEEIFHELPWPESVLYCIRDGSSGKHFYTSGLRELGIFGETRVCVHWRIPHKLVCSAMSDEGILD